ncbi:MAG: hypothetical protein LQ340_002779 [Diploschistes diacapsis]|nr:MAG: hypothetical protein LQ340_002779 [Diploschistes diacapsis]
MLELGLQRISRLVDTANLSWRAIHVAGTNGKGSVCANIYSMLNRAKIPTGMFTSPHLLDRWDGISLHGKVIEEDSFLDIERQVINRDQRLKLQATEFELLTATAFEAFNRAKVKVGIVEVGVGGATDATNILQDPLVTVITRLALDHQALLGDRIADIATQKAGIMKKRVPCIVDGGSPAGATDVIAAKAEEVESGPLELVDFRNPRYGQVWEQIGGVKSLAPFQLSNLALAYEACKVALGEMDYTQHAALELVNATQANSLPGRWQELSIARVVGRRMSVLLDGAHNPQAMACLGKEINDKLRRNNNNLEGCITWILASSENKSVEENISHIIRPQDDVIAVEFGPVAGMPWVKSFPAEGILKLAQKHVNLRESQVAKNVEQALIEAANINQDNKIVVTGSLYLVSDVLRLLRSKGASRKELGLVVSS